MKVKTLNTVLFVLIAAVVVVPAQQAAAIPSALDHVHNNLTVEWKEPGSPGLPWDNATANVNDHNHLTADPILVANKWDINKAWDNHTLHSAFNNPADTDWAHGMIVGTAVQYVWGGLIPDVAKDIVEYGYNDWIAKATVQYNANKDPWDILAINFDRFDDVGPTDITVNFVEGLAGAYGEFSSTGHTIQFEATPTFELKTAGGLKQIRLGDAGTSGTQISIPVDWSYDGTPVATLTDFDYSVDGGTNWTDAPPVGFGDLDWGGASFGHLISPADQLNIFEMDFLTIALHEIGHSIALGHIGNDLTAIMRTDIADFALFGNTMAIDNDSALAVAIDYTYAVPEPATLALVLVGGFLFIGRRARHRRIDD